jgi:hypothetical protein
VNKILKDISPMDWVERIACDWGARFFAQKRFLADMITGSIVAGNSTVAAISRALSEETSLKQTHKRLLSHLHSDKIDLSYLRERLVSYGAANMGVDDIIAFDPGDISKKHARQMQYLYKVHDGSEGDCKNGYEDFSVELIQSIAPGKVRHIPLYHKLTSAACPDYVSQNRQIIDAIRSIHKYTKNRGIFVFDRGHDRSRVYEKALLKLKDIRWIVRVSANRSIMSKDSRFFDQITKIGIKDLADRIPLSDLKQRAPTERKTSLVNIGWSKVRLLNKSQSKQIGKSLSLVVVHDQRNAEKLVLLTSQDVKCEAEALLVWGQYLDRWGKEEGYRFTKQELGSEKIQCLSWRAIQAQSFITWLTYGYICWAFDRKPDEIADFSAQNLKDFESIEKIKFKYYRVRRALATALREPTETETKRAA